MIFPKDKSVCHINQAIIVSQENQKIHRARNEDACDVYKYKIDGDILSLPSDGMRCDYMLENETKKDVYLIELKGTDVLKALEQIEATIQKFKAKLSTYSINPRVIYRTNTHDIQSSKVINFRSKYPRTQLKTTIIDEKI